MMNITNEPTIPRNPRGRAWPLFLRCWGVRLQLRGGAVHTFLLATEHNFVGLAIAFYGAPAGALAGAISSYSAARRSPRRAVRILLTLIIGPLLGVFAGTFGATTAILVMTSVMERLTG